MYTASCNLSSSSFIINSLSANSKVFLSCVYRVLCQDILIASISLTGCPYRYWTKWEICCIFSYTLFLLFYLHLITPSLLLLILRLLRLFLIATIVSACTLCRTFIKSRVRPLLSWIIHKSFCPLDRTLSQNR